MATSIIKSNNWILKGAVTGTANVTMPTDYNEILLVAKHGTNIMSAVHTKDDVTSGQQYERLGAYYGNAGYISATIELTNTYAKLYAFNESGSEVAASSTFKLYYR